MPYLLRLVNFSPNYIERLYNQAIGVCRQVSDPQAKEKPE
jgi:hypothetical protein